jgi:amino acid transporter
LRTELAPGAAPAARTTVEPARLPKTLGLRDLVLLKVVAIVNFGLIPAVSVFGRATILVWILAFAVFFLPSLVAVLSLARRYPGEGGVYLWATRQFGELHGFISGWCYWTNNLFYIPMQLIYIAGVAAFAGADPEGLGGDKLFVALIAFGWLAVATAANVRGLQFGKWIQNAGAFSLMLLGGLIVLAAVSAWSSGVAEQPPRVRDFDWSMLPAFSVMCLAFVGIELASTMGDEIRDPRRNLPRAAVLAGFFALLAYLVVTAALLTLVPWEEISVVQGLMQALERGAARAGVEWIVAPAAVFTALAVGGAAAAWFAGSARIPFVAGVDRELPPSLGKVHPRWGSPYVAILTNGVVSVVLTGVALTGSTVAEAYQQLLSSTVVIQMIPLLYLFAGLVRLEGVRAPSRVLGGLGFLASALAIAIAFIPPEEVGNAVLFEVKMAAGVLLTLGVGLAFYWKARRAEPA